MNKYLKIIFPAAILSIAVASSVYILHTPTQKREITTFPVSSNNFISNSEDLLTEDEAPVVASPEIISQKIAMHPEYIFNQTEQIGYLLDAGVYKDIPYDSGADVKELAKYDEVFLVGTNDLKYWQIDVNGTKYYIDHDKLTTDKSVIEQMQEEERQEEERRRQEEEEERKRQEAKSQTRSYVWDGSVLTKAKGVNWGPSGKETYYNLPMEGVISIMRSIGNYDEYWIRDDGCKMLGDYIMVAADLSIRPRGSLIECSLGTAIVCDTGSFIYQNPTQLDIAVNW